MAIVSVFMSPDKLNNDYRLVIPSFDIFAHLRNEEMELIAEALDEKLARRAFSDECSKHGVMNVMIARWVKEGASDIYQVLVKVSTNKEEQK